MAKLNPVFAKIETDEFVTDVATTKGVALKTFILLGIALLSAVLAISNGTLVYGNPSILLVAVFGTLICGIAGQVSAKAAKVCSILYAVFEGLMLGLISYVFEAAIGGIILSAVLITFTIFGVMLFLYTTNIVKVSSTFIKAMMVVGISIFVISIVYLISYLVYPTNILISSLSNNLGLLLLVDGLVLLYAAFMLVFDFERVKMIVAHGFDKRYEWMAALGLMVTIVWIYVQVLRILSILLRNRK